MAANGPSPPVCALCALAVAATMAALRARSRARAWAAVAAAGHREKWQERCREALAMDRSEWAAAYADPNVAVTAPSLPIEIGAHWQDGNGGWARTQKMHTHNYMKAQARAYINAHLPTHCYYAFIPKDGDHRVTASGTSHGHAG